jgi:hypothetical protein
VHECRLLRFRGYRTGYLTLPWPSRADNTRHAGTIGGKLLADLSPAGAPRYSILLKPNPLAYPPWSPVLAQNVH